MKEKLVSTAESQPVQAIYREGTWQLFEEEVSAILKEEVKKASQELLTEQKIVIKECLELNKMAIQQIIEEEKIRVAVNVDDLRRQILDIVP
jgi:hypothetical protein